MKGIEVYDTSSLVEASERGLPIGPEVYTIPLIHEEMQHFSPDNGRNGAHIKPEYLEKVKYISSAVGIDRDVDIMKIRKDVIQAHYRANEGKKTRHDDISMPDISLISKVVALGLSGVPITIHSEDQHVYGTIEELSKEPEYKGLRSFLSINRIREA
jgi:hypothetical protein